MDTQSETHLAPELEPVLRRLRKRIRRVISSRGALITTVTALGGLLAIAGIDFAFSPLPPFVRWMLPALWLAGTITAAIACWWLPLRARIDLVRVARWLETRHPELDERISTVLELSNKPGGVSPGLIRQLVKEAGAGIGGINPQSEVSPRRALRWLWPAAVLLAFWSILFVVWPDPTTRHVVRALVPTSKLGNALGRMEVKPGSVELIEGDALRITATQQGSDQPLKLVLHLTDGTTSEQPMAAGDGEDFYQIGKVERSFEYEVRRGRESSDRFKVTVWPQPRMLDARIKLTFPEYTGRAPREQALADQFSALQRTAVELTCKLNTPVESARLEIDETTTGETSLDRSANGGALNSRWTMEQAGRSTGHIVLKHRLGREFEGARFSIESTADLPPEVKWLTAIKDGMRVRPDDLLEPGYEITDDVGLGKVTLEVRPERGSPGEIALDMPPRIGRAEPPVWRSLARQPVAVLLERWKDSRKFNLRIKARDSRPEAFEGPGVGTSEWLEVRIDEGAESLARQEVSAAHSDARETLEEAIQDVRQARERMDRRHEELKRDELKKDGSEDLAEAREKLEEAREELEQLADRMEQSVHAQKADELRKAAAEIEQAKEKLENAPLQDDAEQRGKASEEARRQAENAQRELEKIRDQIQQAEAQVRDFAKLRELEQQQREIARKAEQAAADTAASEEPEQPWQQQQQQVAEAIRQEAKQQPQAESASLAEQAKQAKDLAQEAREQAKGQQALQQASKDPAASKDPLHQQLAEAQAEIAKDVAEQLSEARENQDHATANALPEAADAARKASESLQQHDDKNAVEQAAKAASELAELAKADSPAQPDLKELAERQADVSEALQALEQGKTNEAAAKLSEMQADQAGDLAENIQETPQVNGESGFMQQAAQSSRQAAEQAKQAAQADSRGESSQAAGNHENAARQLEETAQRLEQAANEFQQQAAEMAAREADRNQAPAPSQPLAEAFQEASKASRSNNRAEAAKHAQAAAEALAQTADGALSAMQGKAPGSQGREMAGQPGKENPNENLRSPASDPGVPPELAKLGISAEDWEKIKSSLKSESGGGASIQLPEEYRELVRGYFEQMTKGGKP